MTEENFTNHLVNEKSPYLLQHVHNLVDWYPWGNEAISLAKSQDKPVFLSIGYSTCHWCHVMASESFNNPNIAKLMNESFINIQVDREEMPDIDGLYMEFAQAIMPSGGGWPLNVILTPDLEPFFATTYIPPESGKGFIGFAELIKRLNEMWKDPGEREQLVEQASKILQVFAAQVTASGDELPTREDLAGAIEELYQTVDPVFGGIRGEPKFPMGHLVMLFLAQAKLHEDSRALYCAKTHLDMMQRGGIWDHIGGGFARYSVDMKWHIPHFEKMLYDNAILVRAYLEAYLCTKDNLYRTIADEILTFLLRDLAHPEGAFYSAEDSDAAGKEGLFYTWTEQDFTDVLGPDAPLFMEYFGVTKSGNFEGRSVLHLRVREDEFAERRQLELTHFKEQLTAARQKLFVAREKRAHPSKDDKILAAWNGLAIDAFAFAGRVLGKSAYVKAATEAALFIQKKLWSEKGLCRRWRDGEAKYEANFETYAYYIHGLLTLFEESGDLQWLSLATEMTQVVEREFKAEGGAFFLTQKDEENIVLRRCEFYDGAEPSGNAIHCENLLRFYQLTFDERFLRSAEDILKAARRHIDQHPAGSIYSLYALQRFWDRLGATLVVALNKEEEHKDEIRQMLFSKYLPHHVTFFRFVDEHYADSKELYRLLPHVKDLTPINGKTTLYICQRGQCKAPLVSWEEIQEGLNLF